VAIRYVVQAEVIDIRSDSPRPSDMILVDSNIWFWMTYSGAGLSNDRQARVYPPYVKLARKSKAKLLRCGLSMAELAHGIERAEFEVFEKTHPNERSKEFRHNYDAERAAVVNDVKSAWCIVKSMAAPIALTIDEATTDNALARFPTQLLDGYDLFIAEAIARADVPQVLTDDGDYCTIPGIQVFTANRRVIEAANNQRKLLTR
jgi:hypothetical protein